MCAPDTQPLWSLCFDACRCPHYTCTMFTVDAHLDLAYNALGFGRDLTRPLAELRHAEQGRVGDGRLTVTLPALREAGVGLVFGTLFVAPFDPRKLQERQVYRDAQEAHTLALRQLDYYHRLADEVEYVRLVGDAAGLEKIVASHQEEGERLLGVLPLMEGAEAIREPQEVEMWYERGVRVIGLAWDDTSYAAGAWRGGGGVTAKGYALMERMADLGLILDITHLSEQASLEALERYEGHVVATHSNARALVGSERHLSDTQIRTLAERGGVCGLVLYNRFLKRGYTRTDPRESVTLDDVVAHIDHICQLLGNANHVGIGSDFDGGFGAEHIPTGLDSVLDLPQIGMALTGRGYTPEDVRRIMGENWLDLLRRAL